MKNLLVSALACAIVLTTSFDAAAEVGGYIGARVGAAPEDRFDFHGNLNSDTPYGIYGGWMFSPSFGVEVSYTDLGTSEVVGIADGGFRVDGDLATLGLIYDYAVNDQCSLLAGVGVFDLSEDGEAFTIAGPRPLNLDDNGAYVEVGARFALTPAFAIRTSYQWFDFDANSDGIPSLGAEFSF